jgi:TM2 domain-containing membrane protein YozV
MNVASLANWGFLVLTYLLIGYLACLIWSLFLFPELPETVWPGRVVGRVLGARPSWAVRQN